MGITLNARGFGGTEFFDCVAVLLEHPRRPVDTLLALQPAPLVFLEGPFSGTEERVLRFELEALHGLFYAVGATSRLGCGCGTVFVRGGKAVVVGGPAVVLGGLGHALGGPFAHHPVVLKSSVLTEL